MAVDQEPQGDYTPPSRDEDAVTYLPIQRGKPAPVFGPTDLRASTNTGGIRLGQSFKHVVDEAMPRLEADHVARACDNILRGQETYTSLLYLSRAKTPDIAALIEASQSYEIKVRWERLWVLSVYLSRVSRHQDAHKVLVEAFREDLAGLHLISKFVDQNNPGVKRMFARLHDPLLRMLLEQLVQSREDMRKSALLCGVLATVETQATVLKQYFPKSTASEVVEQLLGQLYTVAPKPKSKRLLSALLKEKLRTWRAG